MKCQTILPACLLLLWTLTVPVSCQDEPQITVKTVSDGIVLTCGKDELLSGPGGEIPLDEALKPTDASTGEYTCHNDDGGEKVIKSKIYVKFRTCDNCIELDEAAIAGLVVGNVVATIVIGVSVYLVAQTRISPDTSHKKSSDRQRLVPNEVRNRGNEDQYQQLAFRGGKDTYDQLNRR